VQYAIEIGISCDSHVSQGSVASSNTSKVRWNALM